MMDYVTYDGHVLIGDAPFSVMQGDLSKFNPLHSPVHPDSLVLDDIWRTTWSTNEVPFMMLVPQHLPFHGPLFERLNYTHRSFPLHTVPGGSWGLDPGVMQEWMTLEHNMHHLLIAMMDVSKAPLPKGFRYWALPKRYGYQLQYRSHQAAQFIASRSRDSFIPLMAALTLMLRIMDDLTPRIENFNWRDRVLQRTGIHPQWLADLEMSIVGDFDSPRVGGIINLATCEFQWLLPLFSVFKMPVYLFWGSIDDPSLRISPYLEQFSPTHGHLSHLSELAAQRRSHGHTDNTAIPSFVGESIQPAAVDNISVPAPPPTLPSVEKFSGQRPGEDWQAFFARQEKCCAVLAANETPKENLQRMQREGHAAKGMVPGRKGARVYVWEDIDGFLIRRAAGRDKYDMFWQDFGPTKRRYNSFLNEWDLCEEFDPTGAPEEDPDEDSDDDQSRNDFPLLPENDASHPTDNNDQFSSETDLRRIHNVPHPDDDQSAQVAFSDHADDTAYYRFGFVKPMSQVKEPTKKLDWKTAQKWLGTSWQVDSYETASKDVISAIVNFFGHLSCASKLADIPMELYDLRQSDMRQQWNVCVHVETFFDKRYYLVSPHPTAKSKEAPFELMLSSAASIIEIMRRQWGPDLVQIAHELMDKGIAFNTCIRGPGQMHVSSPNLSRYGGLGYRPENYKPDYIDYKAYESLRDRFLQSPRGRAAALGGGIVGRLAREAVRFEDVCAGPSDSVLEDGTCFWDGKPSSTAYWDDVLTEDELDLICGVYRVDTGQCDKVHQGRQTSDISWWPKPPAWEVSGLNVGYWSRDCESWLQKRLTDIKAETADLRTPNMWRHSLKFTRGCLTTAKTNEKLASQFLNY